VAQELTVLPIHDPQYVGVTTLRRDGRGLKFPPIELRRPPPGAPNATLL
jgi:hypothetical protein